MSNKGRHGVRNPKKSGDNRSRRNNRKRNFGEGEYGISSSTKERREWKRWEQNQDW